MHNHNHSVCTALAGEHECGKVNPLIQKTYQNILIYARKSDFLHEVMEQIKHTIKYIAAN